MNIYHPSNTLFDIVKIKYFGTNCYTKADVRASSLPRTFWYLTKKIPEKRFDTVKYIYEAKINVRDLYDLRKDKNKFITCPLNIDQLLRKIKRKYIGVIYNVIHYDIIAIFKDLKIDKIFSNSK